MDAQLHLLPFDTDPTTAREAGPATRPTTRSTGRSSVWSPSSGPPAWHLDDDARTVGLAGIARAREVLRAARRAHHDEASAA